MNPSTLLAFHHRGLHKADLNHITSYSRILISFYPYASPSHHLSYQFTKVRFQCYNTNIASPKLKNRYRSFTASS